MTKHNTPALRFDGFRGEWVDTSLSDVADRFDAARVPVTQKDRVPGPYPYYGANGIQDSISGWTHEGQFVLIAEDGANDLEDYPVYLVQGRIWVNNHAHVVQGFPDRVSNQFLAVVLKTVDFERVLVGGSRAKLNASQMMSIAFPIPPNLEEQRAIGELFTELDVLIKQHCAKHANLQQTKTALLQRMFPQDGADEPELRLGGFSGAWEDTVLCDVADRLDAARVPVTEKDRVPGPYPYYGANGIQDFVDGWTHDGQFVLIAEDGANDLEDYPVYLVQGRIWVNNHAHVIQGFSDKMSNEYLAIVLKTVDFERVLVGGSRAKLNSSQMMGIEFPTPPSLEEQRAIGEVFADLDALIAAEHRYITQLTQAKTALLQRMFV